MLEFQSQTNRMELNIIHLNINNLKLTSVISIKSIMK